jgi:RNA polymerase sigma-70 factor, ECF subfamily
MAPVSTLGNRFDAQQPQVAVGPGYPSAAGERSPFSSRQDLIDALKLTAGGDQAAFRRVYAATCVKLFGIIVRILGRQDLAEDVLQEVYIHVWHHAKDFDAAVSSPTSWLVAMARNRALDEARRNTNRSLDDCPELLHVSNDVTQLAERERDGDNPRLPGCLEKLGPDKRTVVVLAYHYGMTSEEIARNTNRPVATVKTWLRRNLAQIKDCLGQ